MALTDNIVSYYKMEANSNDAVASNNGTDTSITYSSGNGKIGQGAGFNGATPSYIDMGTTANLSLSSLTVAGWAYITAGTDYQVFASRRDGGGTLGWELARDLNSPYGLRCTLRGGSSPDIIGGTEMTTGYHHVAFTWDGADLKLYLDGSSTASTVSGTATTTGTANFYFGRRPGGAYLTGNIDEMGVWSRALTSTEITTLYNNGSGLQYPFILGPANLKTFNGLAAASIKTVNGLAIASVKSINGMV